MCGGFAYQKKDPETGAIVLKKVFFPIPGVQVPVWDGEAWQWCQWGKRRGEDAEIDVPLTGWARLQSLKEGKWNHYQPKRVRIPAVRWMEKDAQRNSHWFEVPPERALLGVQIEKAARRFVYIVTRPAEAVYAEVHGRMPLLVAGEGACQHQVSLDFGRLEAV
jgi:hypothetical protein